MNVLVLPEDFVKDESILKPLVEAMLSALGRPRAKVRVCKHPRFHGTSEALRWEFIKAALDRHKGMVDLFLLLVDRDGDPNRRFALANLETRANELDPPRVLLAESAWREVEAWVLAGHDLLPGWVWKKVLDDPHPKEHYFQEFAERRGVRDQPGEGRGMLAREAFARYDRIRQRCPEDVQVLHQRVQTWIERGTRVGSPGDAGDAD